MWGGVRGRGEGGVREEGGGGGEGGGGSVFVCGRGVWRRGCPGGIGSVRVGGRDGAGGGGCATSTDCSNQFKFRSINLYCLQRAITLPQ